MGTLRKAAGTSGYVSEACERAKLSLPQLRASVKEKRGQQGEEELGKTWSVSAGTPASRTSVTRDTTASTMRFSVNDAWSMKILTMSLDRKIDTQVFFAGRASRNLSCTPGSFKAPDWG